MPAILSEGKDPLGLPDPVPQQIVVLPSDRDTHMPHMWIRNIMIWKPQPEKVYNDGIYLVYARHMTTYSIYLEYTWYIPVI
jgi:hypothetical protein